MPRLHSLLPAGALVAGAAVWGVIWYPYRLLNGHGIGGILATVITYSLALALGGVVFWRDLRSLRPSPVVIVIALAAAACNLGYVVATLTGEVMRVLLLFYLAPLWTVVLARGLLGERLTPAGWGVIGLSLCGAFTMLWRPEFGAPWPAVAAEWIGLAAGFCFALSNVLIRRAADLSIEAKSLSVFIGVIALGGVLLAFGVEAPPAFAFPVPAFPWLIGIGVVLLLVNLVVQYGLMHTPANRAIVILLSELVFAALSSWWLAGETMNGREWFGAALISAASLLAARMAPAAEAA